MKFITEMELRDLYKTRPFSTFALHPDTKITPGARQFLVDRRVALISAHSIEEARLGTEISEQAEVRESWCTLRLHSKMQSLESLFLLAAAELFHSGKTDLSEEVVALGRCFQKVRNSEKKQTDLENIEFWGMPEAELRKHAAEMENCFDVTEEHIITAAGKELTLLNYLRASLSELEPAILETYWNEEKQVCSRQELIDAVKLMKNILCMLMWKCLGGEKWRP